MLLDGYWKVAKDPKNKGEEIGYQKENYDDSAWLKIRVPGHWQEESNELREYSGILWYRSKFEYRKTSNKVVWLKFNGVFYKTTVWLNGKRLGMNEGYFFPFKFNITNIVKENNTLAVKVESYNEKRLNSKKQIAGIFYHWDCRDPTFNPGGIWKSIEIYETGIAWIERVKIIPKIVEDYAEIRLLLIIGSVEEKKVSIHIEIKPHNFEGEQIRRSIEIDVKPGTNTIEQIFKIKNPKLWWTWDTGKQNMYCVQIQVFSNGDLSDQKTVRFGIKNIELEKRRNGWVFYLNGKRLFIRGTNYGPTKQRLSYVSREDIEKDVRMMREANINMVRIHAHVFPDALEVFDEYGILVWQDMPLQWMYSKKTEKTILENAKHLVKLTENNPSLAV
ncbi:MAG: glycoside hydrolase family 2 protein, partial [Candidatus Njordarchaeota archaeon]